MNLRILKSLLVFLTAVHAYNKNNRLVDVWDNLLIRDEATLAYVNSFNMTSFPYIEGVSPKFKLLISFSVPNQQNREWILVLRRKLGSFQYIMQPNATFTDLDPDQPFR